MRGLIRLAAVLGFTGVAMGAFGAHALKARLGPDALATYTTAVNYHLVHALAVLAVAALGRDAPERLRPVGIAFGVGVAIFSGSLYVLAITGERWLGAITPLGGVSFLVGWALLFARAR